MNINSINVLLSTVIRTGIVYILALFLTRIMGRKLISQMTFFDFVVGVSMGSIVANAMVNPGEKAYTSAAALITMSILSIGTAYLYIKSFKARKLVNSEPVTLVQNGAIVEENMKNIRLTIDELMMKLREKNAFSLADVEFAIMETDGKVSVLPKVDKKPVTPSQMNIQTTSAGLMRDIIIDGTLMEENLQAAGLDKAWVNNQLKSQNIKDVSEVFYAGVDNSKSLHVSKKSQNQKEKQGQYGIE